jgi:hypothetical protein
MVYLSVDKENIVNAICETKPVTWSEGLRIIEYEGTIPKRTSFTQKLVYENSEIKVVDIQ